MALPFRSSRKSTVPDSHWGIGDPIPAPEATEKGAESGWELWEQARQQQEQRFAPTEPAEAGQLAQEKSAWANTVPADAASGVPPYPGPHGRTPDPAITLEAALRLSSRNGRVCPRPLHWVQFTALLTPRRTLQGVQHPPPALVGPDWNTTPERAKRNCFREQVEWAERVGKLRQAMEFMARLREEDWLHAGE